MSVDECYKLFLKYTETKSFSDIPEKTVIQVDIIGKEQGSFVLNFDGENMVSSMGENKKKDVHIIITMPMLQKMLDGVVDHIYAYTTGKFKMFGNIGLGRSFLNVICDRA